MTVVRRRSERTPPSAAMLRELMNEALLAAIQVDGAGDEIVRRLRDCAGALTAINDALRGTAGLRCVLGERRCIDHLDRKAGALQEWTDTLERRIGAHATHLSAKQLEAFHAALMTVRDALCGIRNDRIRWGRSVGEMARPEPGEAAIEGYASIHTALSALDRLEVRGRDSAGLHVLVTGHGLELDDPELRRLLEERRHIPLFRSGSVRTSPGRLSLVYKVASEIGELGDNCRTLRSAITEDVLLRRALESQTATTVVLAHTRWASVGTVNEPNAHPVNGDEEDELDGPEVVAALNGDVDNHLDLVAGHRLRIQSGISTDAKVIPVLVRRRLAAGMAPDDAFRETVAELTGSVAIAAVIAESPGRQLLAVRGSGQALYVGLADDAYIVASEPYGVVELTSRYLRIDGAAGASNGTCGQVVALDQALAGTLEGVSRVTYDGAELPLEEHQLRTAEITTRDVDRAGHPHYLLKEITEAPASMCKTLRGRIAEIDGRLVPRLGPETLPTEIRNRLAAGLIKRVFVIGQGTAAVAGQGVAAAINGAVRTERISAVAMAASELSGFGLAPDMSDTLVIAITQSGTTTDTNRTVEMLRARAASVIGIVNRRNSDITHRCDGILFTSDGRDVEMSVASTKAYYCQLAAGALLAFAIAEAVGEVDTDFQHEVLSALQDLPAAMEKVLATRPAIARIAAAHAPRRRHWAVVGNGLNRIAAEEIRIKLSELCYKSVALDATEDKKHIDLSSEPLTLVCAAGLTGSAADDVVKEVAIFRAHNSAPVVIASEGERRFSGFEDVLTVPATHPALALDAQAAPLRLARAALQAVATTAVLAAEAVTNAWAAMVEPIAEFERGLLAGRYEATMSCSTAAQIVSLSRAFNDAAPSTDAEGAGVGDPSQLLDTMTAALTRGVDELTRPVDAIKHQAKTVTVGITRRETRDEPLPIEHVLEPVDELPMAPVERLDTLWGVVPDAGVPTRQLAARSA
ncbi:MAG: SIS domain-containing protein [Actinobacteria bacterium]|nr:SIS domain-containing protein [Actinomycetota bacterium]